MAKKKNILHGTGALLATIDQSSVYANPDCSVSQENHTVLTSYNLLPKNRKTIIVPGSPPLWNPKPLPCTIPADQGVYTQDPVRLAFPHCPLEPLFRALETTRPDVALSSFDIVSDRRNLRALLAFTGGSGEEFRIDVERVGGTVMFSVWTPSARGYVNGKSGYGRNFESTFTKNMKSSEGSITHNRAISYSLGGIRIMLRFEVDGCMSHNRVPRGRPNPTTISTAVTTTPTGFRIARKGLLAAEESIIELKTGREGKNLNYIDQMWFSKTPILISGFYQGTGTFIQVTETDVLASGKLREWEMSHKEKLQKLVRVLEMIRESVREVGRYALVVKKGSRQIAVHALDDKYLFGLPNDIKARWR